jgi:hypothetical protein
MKKILYILSFLLLSIFSACDTSDFTNEFRGKQFVFFDRSTLSLGEGGTTGTTVSGSPVSYPSVAEIIVRRSSPDVSAELTVNFTMTSKYLRDSDFFDEGDPADDTFISTKTGQIIIPAGEYSAKFTVTAVNDLLSSGDKLVELKITGTSNTSYSIGVPGGTTPRTDLKLTISDDDCPINIPTNWVGTYTIDDIAPEGSTNAGLSLKGLGFYSGDLALEADATDPAGITAILKNATAVFLQADTKIVFNTCPKTMTVSSPFNLGFNVSGSRAAITGITSATFNPTAFKIEIKGNLTNAGGSNFGAWNFTFSKK